MVRPSIRSRRRFTRMAVASFSCAAAGFGEIDRGTLDERCIVDFPGAQLGECSLGAGGRMDDGGDQAGLATGISRGARRWIGVACDSVSAHGDSSAVSSARTGVDRILGRSCAAHASRAARWLGSRVSLSSTATTSSWCMRRFSADGKSGFHGLAVCAAQHGLDHARDPHDRRIQRLAHHTESRRDGGALRYQSSGSRPASDRRRRRARDAASAFRKPAVREHSGGNRCYALAEDFAAAAGAAEERA